MALKKEITNQETLIGLKQAKINEERQKNSDKTISKLEKQSKKTLEQNRAFAEQEAIRAEIALIESGSFEDEKLKEQLSLLTISRLSEEYGRLEDIADKEKVKLELLRESLKYEQLISIEQQLRGDKSETAEQLIILNEQLLGIEKDITSQKSETFFEQVALTAMKVQELLISKKITQEEADAYNTKIQAIAETRLAQDK